MLTKEQIDELFDFCEKHRVHYYDIQVEIVDHLANAVEAKMKANAQLPFDAALYSVYHSFGVKGFADIVKTRKLGLEKTYTRMRKQFILSYLTWPKAVVTVCLFLAFAFVSKRLTGEQLRILNTACLYSLLLFEIFILITIKRLHKQQTKQLLITEAGRQTSFLVGMIVPVFLFRFGDTNSFFNKEGSYFFASYYIDSFVKIFFLVGMLAYKNIYQNVHRQAKNEYPEVFAVVNR